MLVCTELSSGRFIEIIVDFGYEIVQFSGSRSMKEAAVERHPLGREKQGHFQGVSSLVLDAVLEDCFRQRMRPRGNLISARTTYCKICIIFLRPKRNCAPTHAKPDGQDVFPIIPSCPPCPVHQQRVSEIERLELMIAETKNSIEKYKGQGVSTDTQRKKVLRGLEEQLFITEVRLKGPELGLVSIPTPMLAKSNPGYPPMLASSILDKKKNFRRPLLPRWCLLRCVLTSSWRTRVVRCFRYTEHEGEILYAYPFTQTAANPYSSSCSSSLYMLGCPSESG